MDDPQVAHLQTFAQLTPPEIGPYTAVRRPVTFDGTRDDQPLSVPPELNADGPAILKELGLA